MNKQNKRTDVIVDVFHEDGERDDDKTCDEVDDGERDDEKR